MADTPWTPGPYHTSPWGDGSSAPGTLNVLSKAAHTVIAKDLPEAEAKLFSAAPDMAEALERLVRLTAFEMVGTGNEDRQPWRSALDSARSALAKAWGNQ